MPDQPYPYTVSGVVDTISADMVATVSVHDGHVDFDDVVSNPPLAATEQFRWVHIFATDRAAAAATDALTADLRPGGDHDRPVARALSGAAGLKPYSVAAVVRTRTGRPIGEPVVAEGHLGLAGATFVGRRGTRAHTANVWARDRADAIAQVFGANPHTRGEAGPRTVGSARGDPADRGQVVTLDAALAHREWNRLGGLPAAARAALVADTVWNREYPMAYRTAYTAATIRISAVATEAAVASPGAWLTLHQLAASAGEAFSRLASERPAASPADQRIVAAAVAAAATPGRQPPWRRVADLAAAGARTAGTQAGSLTATADILSGWRARGGHAIAEGVAVQGKPARAWVAELLATVNRDIASPSVPSSGRTAAQLAREDQAPGVASSTVAAVSSRTRTAASPAPPSTTTRRTR